MAIEAHVNVARAGNSSINLWKTSNPNCALDLRSAKFQGLDLSSCDLSQALLDGAEFLDCQLKNTSFSAAKLNRAKFINCNLAGANFENAAVVRAQFRSVEIEGAKFGDNSTISRLGAMEFPEPNDHPSYQTNNIPFYDKYFSWDRVRFLKSINVFVPSYGALILSVLYLNGVALYNDMVITLNGIISERPELLNLQRLEPAEPGSKYLLMLAAFSMLAIAATMFLACPSRVSGYTKEQWKSELGRTTLSYDLSTWSFRPLRILCCLFLISGGIVAALLLVLAVLRQVSFILANLASTGG